MTTPGGGKVDVEQLLRQLGADALLREAEAMGLSPRNRRVRCPWSGCRDKGPERERDATVHGHHPRISCFACGEAGDLVDLLKLSRGLERPDAIRELAGLPPPAPRPPRLRVVPAPGGAEDPEKLTPAEVKRLWEAMAHDDDAGERYLAGRGLDGAPELGLVRYATEGHPDKKTANKARRGYRVAVLLLDVVGNPRGIQLRRVGEPPAREPKILSVDGSTTGKAFFGAPDAIEASPLVAVGEGMADTLALACWARGRDVAVVGAAGKGSLARLAEELEAAGVPLEGKLFALFPQNDRPKNHSRREFVRLGQQLSQRGARVVLVATDAEFKDVAEWRQARPDADWPPAEVARALAPEPGDETPREAQLVEPSRGGLPIPARIHVEAYEADLQTLVAILDDPVERESVMGRRGEIAFNEMTGELNYAGQELDETDVTGIQIQLLQRRTLTGKRLKFQPHEVWSGLNYLSKRRKMHPVRDYLQALKWDGKQRLGPWTARAFGLRYPSLEAELVRKWFISAAARAIEPGCKVDTVLILVGDEGLHKTTLFKMLAGKEYFTSSTVHIGEADGYSVLRHNWIVEWGELDSMRRARDQQAIRNFLSGENDFYRPKWGIKHQRFYRSCVIVGTTNDERFLQGDFNRRMWPVRVESIDYEALQRHRDQLWAEAAWLYQAALTCEACRPTMPEERCAAHRWFLKGDEAAELREHNLQFLEEDEWVTVLREWISENRPSAMTTARVLKDAIGKPPGQWIPGKDPARAADALKALGWQRPRSGGRRHEGEVGRFWLPPGAV
jgi:hypothetical protein